MHPFFLIMIKARNKILSMKVRLIGAGAVGVVVAAKLNYVSDFALIAKGERKDKYEHGIFLNGERIDFKVLSPDEADKADLLIIAVKNFQLEGILDDIAPFVGDDTAIISLLNGIDAERILCERFGSEKVLYAFITDLSSNHSGVETVCFSNSGTIIFGEKDNSATSRMEKITNLFQEAGQRFVVPKDIMHEKWWKFMLNTCYNTLSAILDADYCAMCDNTSFVRAVRLVAKEVQIVAKAEGISITQDDIEEMIRRVGALTDHGKTSMLQDVQAARETENRYFAGAVSRLGKKHGIATPFVDFSSILLEARRHVVEKY